MNKKQNRNYIWFVICIICIVCFVVLGICSGFDIANAQEQADDTGGENEIPTSEKIVALISGSEQDIALQIEMWQEYIDKYIMPNALAVLTSVSMVFAVFSKFKNLLELYKQNKAEFDAEKDNIFAELKSDVSAIMETLKDVGNKTTESIDNMPIESIQADLSNAKTAIEAEMQSIQDFTKLFEIFLSSERKLVETSYLSVQDKNEMRKLLYEGEQIAKKNQTALSSVSDLVLSAIGKDVDKSDEGSAFEEVFQDVNFVESISDISKETQTDKEEVLGDLPKTTKGMVVT